MLQCSIISIFSTYMLCSIIDSLRLWWCDLHAYSAGKFNDVLLWLCLVLPQERQRLETILNLCAEYNKGENADLDPLVSGRTGLADGSGRRPSMDNVLGGILSSPAVHLAHRQRENDEENLKEECSSTESTHQEVRTSPAPSTASALHNGDRQVRGSAYFPSKTLTLHAAVKPACASNVLGCAISEVLKRR